MAIRRKETVIGAALALDGSIEVETYNEYITLSRKEAKKLIKELQAALIKINSDAQKNSWANVTSINPR